MGVALACLVLAGCAGGGQATRAQVAPPAPPARPYTRPNAPTPAPSTTPPVTRQAYVDAFEEYCATTVRSIRRLARTRVDERDPVAPIATLARRYRAGLEQLGGLTPPGLLRRTHLLTLAQGRESADRIDDGVRLGRAGDIDAATTALGELAGLLPDREGLPASIRRGAPTCVAAASGP